MMIALHKNATTTPAVRAQIQQSSASEYELAEQYGISRTTVQRWKHRDSVEDRSHTPHQLQTTLNAGQEELVVYLRKQLRLPLDDLLAVVREFVHPTMGRVTDRRNGARDVRRNGASFQGLNRGPEGVAGRGYFEAFAGPGRLGLESCLGAR